MFEVGKVYRTRAGDAAVIERIAESQVPYPIYGRLESRGGGVIFVVWTLDGRFSRESEDSRDLMPEEVVGGDPSHDPVANPRHYTSHPSGIECIQVTEHMGFCLGNAVKYIWRADLKADAIEDLRKAKWYIERELEKRWAK